MRVKGCMRTHCKARTGMKPLGTDRDEATGKPGEHAEHPPLLAPELPSLGWEPESFKAQLR